MNRENIWCIPSNSIPPFIIKSSFYNSLFFSQKMRRLCSSELITVSLAYPKNRYVFYIKSLLHSLPYNHFLESPYGDIGNGDNSFRHQPSTYYPNIPSYSQSPIGGIGIGDSIRHRLGYIHHKNPNTPISQNCFFLHKFFGWVNNTQNNTKSVTFTSPTEIFCGVMT